jgi:uncharacterized membrane protein
MPDLAMLVRLAGGALVVLIVATLWEPVLRLLPAEWLMGLAGVLIAALAVLALRVLRRGLNGPR